MIIIRIKESQGDYMKYTIYRRPTNCEDFYDKQIPVITTNR